MKKWILGVSASILSGLVLWFVTSNFAQTSDADVRIVDIVAIHEEDGMISLDINIRNTGDQPAFITDLEISFVDVQVVTNCFVKIDHPGLFVSFPYAFTGEYDLDVAEAKRGSTSDMNINQVILSKNVDRFKLRLLPENPYESLKIHKAVLSLIFNETDEKVVSDAIVFSSFLSAVNEQWIFGGEIAEDEILDEYSTYYTNDVSNEKIIDDMFDCFKDNNESLNQIFTDDVQFYDEVSSWVSKEFNNKLK